MPVDAEDPDELARRARVADAVRARHRHHAAVTRQREELTVPDGLLGAIGGPVTLRTSGGGGAISGQVSWVGDDVVEVEAATRRWWIRSDRIVAIESAELAPGDRRDQLDVGLDDLLADLVDTGVAVVVLCAGGIVWHGSVEAVGAALTLRRELPLGRVLVALEHVIAVGLTLRAEPDGADRSR